MTGLELQEEMKARRKAQYYQGRAWAWSGPSGVQRLGVIGALGHQWLVGYVQENGSHKAFKSTAFADRSPNMDPAPLFAFFVAWAVRRKLQEVEL